MGMRRIQGKLEGEMIQLEGKPGANSEGPECHANIWASSSGHSSHQWHLITVWQYWTFPDRSSSADSHFFSSHSVNSN